jgi:hypothetical protein
VNQKRRRRRKAEQKLGKEMELMAGSQWTRTEGQF